MAKFGMVTCPKCGTRVLPKQDGTCPSCRAVISSEEDGAGRESSSASSKVQPRPDVRHIAGNAVPPANLAAANAEEAIDHRHPVEMIIDALKHTRKGTGLKTTLWVGAMIFGILALTAIFAIRQNGLFVQPTPTPPKIVGEITEWGPVGQMSPNFSGTFGGTWFSLKEYPGRKFQILTKSFDEAAKLGVMTRDATGAYQFQDLTGWKVEITSESVDSSTDRVTSLRRLNP